MLVKRSLPHSDCLLKRDSSRTSPIPTLSRMESSALGLSLALRADSWVAITLNKKPLSSETLDLHQ